MSSSLRVRVNALSSRDGPLRERPLLFGPAYGLLLYGIMTYIVVPLSAARSRGGGGSAGTLWIVLSILVHMFLIGLPIAMFTQRAFRPAKTDSRVAVVSHTEA